MSARYQVIPVHGIPLVKRGDDIALLIADALNRSGLQLQAGDIVVVSHKIVSVSEGCVVPVSKIRVSEKAYAIARMNDADPFKVELALEHSVGVLRESPVLITVTPQGIITDYAGVDRSNTPEGSLVTLPPDPDASASRIREDIRRLTGTDVGVIIVDTQGRPWRQGAVNVAIGASGVATLISNRGRPDLFGRPLRGSVVCLADELAQAAELVMGQADEAIPVAIIRGLQLHRSDQGARGINRPLDEILFK